MRIENAPRALGLIPDGNRRWARSHRESFLNGYRYGVKKFMDFAQWSIDYGVRNIAVWAFSTENFNRPREEVNTLFNIYRKAATDKDILSMLHDNKARFNIVGNRALLPRDLVNSLHKIELSTKVYTGRSIQMLLAYGGRDDILHAAKALVKEAVHKKIRNVTDTLFRAYMLSSQVPDMDMIIRTSGEERLSGFMPWQSEYSELYFSNKLWPDFTKRDLETALVSYSKRQRRFGT